MAGSPSVKGDSTKHTLSTPGRSPHEFSVGPHWNTEVWGLRSSRSPHPWCSSARPHLLPTILIPTPPTCAPRVFLPLIPKVQSVSVSMLRLSVTQMWGKGTAIRAFRLSCQRASLGTAPGPHCRAPSSRRVSLRCAAFTSERRPCTTDDASLCSGAVSPQKR